MNRLAIYLLLSAAVSLVGCGGSGSATASVPGQTTPIPAHSRLLFHGVLHSDINLSNFPPGGTGQIYVYDDVTGELRAQLAAQNGSHFDASSLPSGRAVKVFFVPKAMNP